MFTSKSVIGCLRKEEGSKMNNKRPHEPSPEEIRAEATKIKAQNIKKGRRVRPDHANASKIVIAPKIQGGSAGGAN